MAPSQFIAVGSIDQLVKGDFNGKSVKIKGIPRGPMNDDIWFIAYLDDGSRFLELQGLYLGDGDFQSGKIAVSRLRALSESNRQVEVCGVYRPTNQKTGSRVLAVDHIDFGDYTIECKDPSTNIR